MVIVRSYLLGVPYSEVGTETERWNETLPLNSISGQIFLSNMLALGARVHACDTLTLTAMTGRQI